MNTADLQKLAGHARHTREAGTALVVASFVLAVFLFIPLTDTSPAIEPVVLVTPIAAAYQNVSLQAKAAIVYDLTSEEVLYGNNADAQLPLASLTKLLTVYAALEHLAPLTPITVSRQATDIEDAYAFSKGDTLSLKDIARLTLTASLNDGAGAIAEAVVSQKQMSEVLMLASAASALDLSQTYAINGSGLDISTAISGGYGSAQDIARLAGALAQKFPDVAEATTHPKVTARSQGGDTFTAKNTSPVVSRIPGLLLSKTGYTELAEGNLAIVFDVGIGHPVAVVVLSSSLNGRFSDGLQLVNATFDHFSRL